MADGAAAGRPKSDRRRTPSSASSRGTPSVVTWCSCRRRSRTCAAGPRRRRSAPSKSSTTRSESHEITKHRWTSNSSMSERRRARSRSSRLASCHGTSKAGASRSCGRCRWQVRGACDAGDLRGRLPDGSARPAAEHVPGLRLAPASACACGARRSSVLSGSACCVYGLTFTSHFYGARRSGRLRPLQLGVPGHGEALRGPARGGLQSRGAIRREYDTDRRDQPVRAERRRACPCGSSRGRSTASASSGSTSPASASRPTPRRRTCSPPPCCAYARDRGRWQGPVQAPRAKGAAPIADCDLAFSARSSPSDPILIGRHARADGPQPPGRWCRPASGASSTPRSTARSVAAVHPFYSASHARVRPPPAAPSSAPAPVGRRRHRSVAGRTSAPTCGVSREKIDAAKNALPAGDRRGAGKAKPIDGPDHPLGLRGLRADRRSPARRERRRRAVTSAPPARARPTPNLDRAVAGPPAGVHGDQYRASLEQDLAAMREVSSPTSPSVPPRSCKKAKEQGNPRALLHQPHLGAPAHRAPMGAGSLAQVVNAALANEGALRRDDRPSSRGSAPATPPASGKTAPRRPSRVPREVQARARHPGQARATAETQDHRRSRI